MRLFLIRHGQTEWNVARLAQGHSDIPLDEIGEDQVRRLANAFQGRRFSHVFTSDLKRSYKTAEPLAEVTRAELVATAELRERSFGEWEGKPYEAIRAGVDPELEGYGEVRGEVRFGSEGSRVDLLLSRPEGGARCFLEVKNVTAAVQEGVALFPDAVSRRASKHPCPNRLRPYLSRTASFSWLRSNTLPASDCIRRRVLIARS